jgi:hypothetical protein
MKGTTFWDVTSSTVDVSKESIASIFMVEE